MASSVVPSPNLHSVFVYGSLMADDVVQSLLKRVPSSSPAALSDFHRFSIKGRVYPAIIPVKNKKVTGKVLLGITDLELDVLDAFEDNEYERRAVEISLIDKSEKLIADAYVWENKNDPNLYGQWDFEEWKQLRKKEFLAMTREFIQEYEQSQTKSRVAMYESYYGQGQLMR